MEREILLGLLDHLRELAGRLRERKGEYARHYLDAVQYVIDEIEGRLYDAGIDS